MKRFALLLVLLVSQKGLAWDHLLHKTVATIAAKHINQQTAAQIQALLGQENMIDVASWADQIKSSRGWSHTATYHYASVNDGQSYLQTLSTMSPAQIANGDVVMSVMKANSVLRDPRADQKSKAVALKMLIHMVGDLFQPLHTGRIEDRGGNNIKVEWFGQTTKLHFIWDGLLLETAFAKELNGIAPQQQHLWLADTILKRNPMPLRFACNLDVGSWFLQSLETRRFVYEAYDRDNNAYIQKNGPIMEGQVLRSGISLACMLNEIFRDPTHPTPVEVNFVKAIDSAARVDFLRLINFTPN